MDALRNTALCLPDLPVEPVAWDVTEHQEEQLRSFFDEEQWAWIEWMERENERD
jgi:hypothetical protein